MPDNYVYFAIFIETITIFFIWCQLSIDWKFRWQKVVFCVLFLASAGCLLINNPLSTLIGQLSIILTVMLVFRKPLKDTLIEFAVIMVVISLIIVAISGVLSIFIKSNSYWSFVQLIALAIGLVVLITIARLVPVRTIYLKLKPSLEKGSLLLINALVVINVINFYGRKVGNNDFIAILLQLCILIAVTYAFMQSFFESKQKENMLQLYQQQSSTITPLIEEIRSRQHDFKNHINTIYGMLQSGSEDKDSAIHYIESLNDSLKELEMLIPIKDKTIAAIIYSKACEAQAAGIDFNYVLPPYEISFPMRDYEYASVLGNLLDNAFEAPAAEGVRKAVILRMFSDDTGNCLEVSNNGQPIATEALGKVFRKGFSTKQGKGSRGYGLYTVKKISNSYTGNVEVLQDGDFTTFRISFATGSY